MYLKMLKLRLLNTIAPAYFFTATTVTFALQFYFFIPAIFENPDARINSSTLLHGAFFLFLILNALGNYVMTIRFPAASVQDAGPLVCSPRCADRVDAHYLLNGRHFCAIPGLQFFVVLMLYVWLGIGLTCAGFCCQQILLVARGQTWCQLRKGQVVQTRSPWRSNLSDVFGRQWVLGLFLPVQTVGRLQDHAADKKES